MSELRLQNDYLTADNRLAPVQGSMFGFKLKELTE